MNIKISLILATVLTAIVAVSTISLLTHPEDITFRYDHIIQINESPTISLKQQNSAVSPYMEYNTASPDVSFQLSGDFSSLNKSTTFGGNATGSTINLHNYNYPSINQHKNATRTVSGQSMADLSSTAAYSSILNRNEQDNARSYGFTAMTNTGNTIKQGGDPSLTGTTATGLQVNPDYRQTLNMPVADGLWFLIFLVVLYFIKLKVVKV